MNGKFELKESQRLTEISPCEAMSWRRRGARLPRNTEWCSRQRRRCGGRLRRWRADALRIRLADRTGMQLGNLPSAPVRDTDRQMKVRTGFRTAPIQGQYAE